MSEPMIRLTDVTKTFPGQTVPAVGDLSFDIAEGEIVVLVGPSGCGKTTTLKMINRLVEATGGTIEVAGHRYHERSRPPILRQGIGYVIQRIGLFPHRTIAENIATVPGLLGWDKDRIRGSGHRADRAGWARTGDEGPVPVGALRRPAATGWGRPGARRRPAGVADGRAVRGGRSDRAEPLAGRAPRPAAASPQDHRVRDPRHRRGHQAG